MANVSLKTDFTDGEKLFGQQLNNNFAVIKAALEAMNKIVWQDDPDDSVTAFRGTTEEINQRDIIDGQLLYDTSTGETYIDVGSQRISTGSGNAIHIGSDTPSNPSTQIWIDPNEPLQLIGTEVVNSMEGTESNKAPSVQAIKNYMNSKMQILWTNEYPTQAMEQTNITLSSSDYDILEIFFVHKADTNFSTYSIRMLKNSVGTRCFIPSIDGVVYRVITKNTDTSITVDSVTNSVDNSLAVPLYIIGYKTGILN